VEVASAIAFSGTFAQARTLGMSRYLGFFAPVMALTGIFLSQSRGELLATTVGFLVFVCLSVFYVRGWRRVVLISSLACLAGMVMIFMSTLLQLWQILVALGESSVTNRLSTFDYAIALIQKDPFMGYGFFAVEKLFATDHILHNTFLMIFVALGGGGFVLYLSLFLMAIVSGLRCIRPDDPRAPFAISLLAGLAAILVELNLYNGDTAPINSVVLALLLALPYIPLPASVQTPEQRAQRLRPSIRSLVRTST
jgi:O-antigen ligase